MSFIVSKIVWPLTTPSTLLALLILAAAILALTRWRRAARRLLLAIGVAVGLIMALSIDTWLIMPLEARFAPPASLPARVDGIVVLGGAVYESPMPTLAGAQLNSHADRVAALMILARRFPEAEIIYSGGDATLFGGRHEADLAQSMMREMGVDVGRITFERESRNTHENAVNTLALADPQPGEVWLLVTSAVHMPRSVGVFRAAGWNAIPYPVDFRTRQEFGVFDIGPAFSSKLGGIDLAAHEWIGLLAYRVLGYSDSVFPGPDS